jgi:FkbM family methyltransferase
MELVPGDVISDCIAFTGVYELTLTRRVVQLAKKGGTLVDIGANLGYFAILWAAARSENRCIAFEPSPRNIDILRRNVHRNGLESQITVLPVAAGIVPGKLWFDLGPTEQTGWGGFASGYAAGRFETTVVRADETVLGTSAIHLLKVDTEGADAWALMGCERLLKTRAVHEIWFEQHKPRIRALGIPEDAAQDYLRSVGYLPRPIGNASAEVVEWFAVPD